LNASATAIQNMRVDHRRADIAVPQQLLYGPDIVSIFQQMRGERMAQGVIILLTNSLSRRSITDIIPFMEPKSK